MQIIHLFFSLSLMLTCAHVVNAQESLSPPPQNLEKQSASVQPLSDNLEDLKKSALELNRDLLILEEELLFPANTQVVVFLSMDVGQFFAIDSVKLKINDKLVASHLYTEHENDSLIRGGIHRLYIGNLKYGEHEVTAVYTGKGPDNRDYKRAATLLMEKDDEPKILELQIRDANSNMQPTFDIKEWEL